MVLIFSMPHNYILDPRHCELKKKFSDFRKCCLPPKELSFVMVDRILADHFDPIKRLGLKLC